MKIVLTFTIMLGFLKSLFDQNKKPNDFPPKPKWKPNIPVDISIVADRVSYYTDKKRIVVIFTHGTCVVLDAMSANPEEEAASILDRVYRYHPDFNPQSMDDGNYIVSYSQPNCFSVVTKEEFVENMEYIQKNHLDGVVRDEVLLNAQKQPNIFDESGMLGLFGRARMFMDAQQPKVIRVVRPN